MLKALTKLASWFWRLSSSSSMLSSTDNAASKTGWRVVLPLAAWLTHVSKGRETILTFRLSSSLNFTSWQERHCLKTLNKFSLYKWVLGMRKKASNLEPNLGYWEMSFPASTARKTGPQRNFDSMMSHVLSKSPIFLEGRVEGSAKIVKKSLNGQGMHTWNLVGRGALSFIPDARHRRYMRFTSELFVELQSSKLDLSVELQISRLMRLQVFQNGDFLFLSNCKNIIICSKNAIMWKWIHLPLDCF